MPFWRNIWVLLLCGPALFISACSVNLVQGDAVRETTANQAKVQNDPSVLFSHIPLILGNDTLWLAQGLLDEYNQAIPQEVYPSSKCAGSANIQAQVAQNAEASPWSIPLFVIPFWPVMPVDETWTYTLQVQILCDGVLAKQAEYKEEETIRAEFYGKLRSDLLNKASRDMHRKLVQRLAFELNYSYNADMGIRSDY